MSSRVQSGLLFIMLCWIWGSTWPAIRLGLNGVPPFLGCALRFLASGTLLVALAFALRIHWPRTRAFRAQILVQGALLFGVNYALVYWAEQSVPSGLAAVLFSIEPMMTAVFAALVFRIERFSFANVFGLVLGFAGVGVIYWSEVVKAAHAPALGVVAVTGAATLAAFASVFAKRFAQGISPLAIVAPGQLLGGLVLSVLAFLTERGAPVHFDALSLGCLAYLSIFGSAVAFMAYFYLLTTQSVTRLSLFNYITPIVAVILGALVVHEQLAAATFVGAGLVFGGVGLVNGRPQRAAGERT